MNLPGFRQYIFLLFNKNKSHIIQVFVSGNIGSKRIGFNYLRDFLPTKAFCLFLKCVNIFVYQSPHTFDEKWFDEGVGKNQWSFNGKTGCPQVKFHPKYCTKLFLKDFFLYTGWGQEKNVREGSRSCPPHQYTFMFLKVRKLVILDKYYMSDGAVVSLISSSHLRQKP